MDFGLSICFSDPSLSRILRESKQEQHRCPISIKRIVSIAAGENNKKQLLLKKNVNLVTAD